MLHRTMTLSIAEYAHELERGGQRVFVDASGSYWRRAEAGALVRMPPFETSAPNPMEIQEVLLRGHAPLVSYIVKADEGHPPNAYLYLCRDRSYALDRLPETVRRHIRRATKALRFSWIDRGNLLHHGLPAFQDAGVRNGLSDCTDEAFKAKFGRWFDNPANGVLAAWKDDTLVAFFITTAVEDWIEIGGYSSDMGLEFRPNNGLVHYLLTHCLTEWGFHAVSYGLSSVQEESKAAGLHQFKTKVGFEAIPVHRTFIPHPLLRPFANRFSLALGHGALKLLPGNRTLRKGCGVLAKLVETA